MSHALILADIEGIIGIRDFMNEVERSKELYTREIEVYIEALQNNGVKKITVCDSHNEGNMILPSIITENVSLVSKIVNIPFQEDYDFAIMVGFHGMSESCGIFPHTLRFDFRHLYAENVPIGEVELYCRWLGAHGVPVILVTGDREAAYEAVFFNPYRIACCVKSLYQNVIIEKSLLYKKLAKHIDIALRLDFSNCLSHDDSMITAEFYNKDTVEILANMGYSSYEGRLVFNNCADFVKRLYTLVSDLNMVNENFIKVNAAFLSEIRKLAKIVNKEDLEQTEVLSLLSNTVITLDSRSRAEILKVFKELSGHYSVEHGETCP